MKRKPKHRPEYPLDGAESVPVQSVPLLTWELLGKLVGFSPPGRMIFEKGAFDHDDSPPAVQVR